MPFGVVGLFFALFCFFDPIWLFGGYRIAEAKSGKVFHPRYGWFLNQGSPFATSLLFS
ncbi:hypothetical protein BO78DRAFT_398568 [Aspergillus sclerotiicarbonarius CBS 121057]|uniref:Uncharacterized protein n=1 Tax=Aspergillus sclerotiicarbonarius (strain CBS 121057 / IBT 28362) TaxID=1448318 RepID=A0A319E683_ASPSB|nr:hypothetical protein BO78DRAFT_398568 [Aspergillus sclerotiicarbonarius CBS 121057]